MSCIEASVPWSCPAPDGRMDRARRARARDDALLDRSDCPAPGGAGAEKRPAAEQRPRRLTFRAGAIHRRPPMTRTGVVLGVSGQIGTAVARRMLAEGWISRGLHDTARALPADLAPVEVRVGDRNDDDSLARLLADRAHGGGDSSSHVAHHDRD